MNSVQPDLHKYFKIKKNLRENATLKKSITSSDTFSDEVHLDGAKKNITPQKPSEIIECPYRKRKRDQIDDEDEIPQTPEEDKNCSLALDDEINPKKTTSAKKRLVMGEEKSENQVKLNPEMIKQKLGKCGRLDELRSRLMKLNQCEEKLEAFRSQTFKSCPEAKSLSPKKLHTTPRKRDARLASSPYKISPLKDRSLQAIRKGDELQLSRFNSLDVEVPVSPLKSPAKVTTPVKSFSKGHGRDSESSSNQLQLPHRYQFIKEVFRTVDTVVSLLHNRQEVITFSKLKPAVQEMLRKTFSQTHLGQLKSVFPLSYFFNMEKLKNKNSNLGNPLSYELTVKPNLEYKRSGSSASRNLMQQWSNDTTSESCQRFRKMDSVVLVERRHIFHSALLDILKKHHEQFLKTLDPPITLDGPIRRWHPEFPLEDVPPPPPASLPQPPEGASLDSAKDVLDRARDVFSVNNRMKEAISSAVTPSTAASKASIEAKSEAVSDKTEIAAALKGVSLSLLEKIRAREAMKVSREMTRSVGASKELEMLSRLPEMARILRSLFVTEKKAALLWDVVVAKVASSHTGSLSAAETETHLNLLMKEVPGWCTNHRVRSGNYLKIDKSKQLHDVTQKLNDVIKEKT